jgi:flagellar P-ring protein FlgI
VIRSLSFCLALMFAFGQNCSASASSVRLKDIGRFDGWRDNPLVGYGIVTGLAGSGDSPRNEVTRQALRNALGRLGATVQLDQIQSRNVAVVMVTATLPPSANIGDKVDVTVTSVGDARSLAGGMLMMTPLMGPDQKTYALAQGSLVVGGYRFDADQNQRQKNYPTVGILPDGASVERSVSADLQTEPNNLVFILKDPDFSTAENVAIGINRMFGSGTASVRSADAIRISTVNWDGALNSMLTRIENVVVETDQVARIVINERSGTVVAGGSVHISKAVVAQGDIKVSVAIDNSYGQPNISGGFVRDAQGLVVTNTRLDVNEDNDAVVYFPGSSVADLVQGLTRARVKTRDMIAIFQALKAAGALHADIIVQ